jgi:hypothetical protein
MKRFLYECHVVFVDITHDYTCFEIKTKSPLKNGVREFHFKSKGYSD